MTPLNVGIGELAVVRGEDKSLRTLSLGSCVAIVVVDRVRAVLGLAHVVLPAVDDDARERRPVAYFTDVGVPLLLTELLRNGSGPRMGPLHIALVGGGRPGGGGATVFNIGERNVAAARHALKRFGLTPAVEDVGGPWSRTVTVDRGHIVVTCPDRAPLEL
ncbi:MAG: chemotaxis protein CheD [Nannocystaceae bacterium]|nr:chemotaxis protein CheD [Nannocystaceae bacterium]